MERSSPARCLAEGKVIFFEFSTTQPKLPEQLNYTINNNNIIGTTPRIIHTLQSVKLLWIASKMIHVPRNKLICPEI